MITDKDNDEVKPKRGMRVKLSYSGREFTIKGFNDKFLVAMSGTLFPIGLDFKLIHPLENKPR